MGSQKVVRWLSAVATLCGAFTVVTTHIVAASGTAPTGDAATIAYYTTAANNLNHGSAIIATYRHDYWFGYSSTNQWRLSWGTNTKPTPYMHAVNDTQTERLRNGKILWETDIFALPCATGHHCSSAVVPLEIFQISTHHYWTELNGVNQSARCWYVPSKTAGTQWINQDFTNVGLSGWYVGGSPYSSAPNYKPMSKSASVVSITSTYTYLTGHRGVTEVDRINASTHMFTGGSEQVAKGSTANALEYSYDWTLRFPTNVPAPPVTKLCH